MIFHDGDGNSQSVEKKPAADVVKTIKQAIS